MPDHWTGCARSCCSAAALALFFLGLGVVLLATDNVVFGVFAIVAAAIVNVTLIVVIARKAAAPRPGWGLPRRVVRLPRCGG